MAAATQGRRVVAHSGGSWRLSAELLAAVWVRLAQAKRSGLILGDVEHLHTLCRQRL